MSDTDLIGPALPPVLPKTSDVSDEEPPIGPALPPVYTPDHSSSSSDENDTWGRSRSPKCQAYSKTMRADLPSGSTSSAKEEDDGFFGPALPPGYNKQQMSPERPPLLGPALPPGFRRSVEEDDENDDHGGGFLGPALPPGYKPEYSADEDDEDEDIVGPLPFKGNSSHNSVALDIERRAQKMKDKLTGVDSGTEVVARETWMTELPPELQHIGLGARTFKKRSGPENNDRSVWTDTPADRERKAQERREGKKSGESTKKDETSHLPQKDIDMAEKVSKYNETKRGESLLSMHTKNLKRKVEEEGNRPLERRPFDRDQDLQVNRFDDAQKKALLKKSAELNTRFSHSKDRMFL